ncbi:MAG: hypothetical protein NXI01_00815 [Gammaproteobacteria bacterium]|nr:hypothetical protein [Gammaproteobacteria bacterium]
MKPYKRIIGLKENPLLSEKIEKISGIACKYGLHEFEYHILEKEFEKLSIELKNKILATKRG